MDAASRLGMPSFEPGRKRGAEYHIFGAACGRDSRERESKRALFEHDPYSITGGPMAGRTAENVGGCERMERNIVDASVVLGSSERESDDSVSVDTNTSHSTDLSLETAHLPAGSKDMVFVETATKLGKGGKKKKSGAARRRRKKERTDASLALFEAETADNARLGALAVVARVLHKVRNLSKSVIKWNVCFASEMARWAAQDAAVTAVWAAERAEDEAQWVAQEVTLTLKIREMVSKGLVRRRRGRRGVGRGRRKRRLEGRKRQRGRQEQMRRAWEREGWRRAELQWAQRQDAWWRSKGGKGASWRLRQRKQRRRRRATASNAMQRLPARGIGPGTGRQGPLQRGVGRASRRQRQKRLRAGKGGAGASGQQQRRLGGGGKRGWVT